MIAARWHHVSLLAVGLALAGAQAQAQDAQAPAAATATADTSLETSDTAIQEGLRSQASLNSSAFAAPDAAQDGGKVDLNQLQRNIEKLNARTQAESDAIRERMLQQVPPEQRTPPASPGATASINIPITGDTIVVKSPILARDSLALAHRAFVIYAGCARIERIDVHGRTATGPFSTTPDGRLTSGLIVERWTLHGCGKEASLNMVFKPTPDGKMDIFISQS